MSESLDRYPEQKPEELAYNQEIASILRNIGEEYGLDPETCDEIADQPFEKAFEIAYGYLSQAGLNADEVLAEFME